MKNSYNYYNYRYVNNANIMSQKSRLFVWKFYREFPCKSISNNLNANDSYKKRNKVFVTFFSAILYNFLPHAFLR